MSKYFSYFPKTQHDLKNDDRSVNLTNILRRFKVQSELTDDATVFYEYRIQDGDRPDTIAEKYYGNSSYSWLVMHFNGIEDAVFGWPMFGNQFEHYIVGKYGSLAAAQSELHEYRIFLKYFDEQGVASPAKSRTLTDGTTIAERVVVVDQTTFNATPAAYKYNVNGVTKYEYEIELNEAKRDIQLLDKKYLPTVRDEVESILRNGI